MIATKLSIDYCNWLPSPSMFDDRAFCGCNSQLGDLIKLRHLAADLNIFSRKISRSHLAGQQKTHFRGRGMEFEEVRLYQPGDDVRSIDWRVTARTQVPHTKVYREERERPVLIVTDLRSPMFFGSQKRFKSVQAVTIATQLAWAALHGNDRVGGLVFGQNRHRDIRPKRSKHQVMTMLQNLCELGQLQRAPMLQHNELSLAQILQDTRRVTRPGTALFVISDFADFDHQAEAQLHLLCRHNDISLMRISDPLEAELPNLARLQISDGAQTATINNNADQRQRHQQQAQQHLQRLQDCSLKQGAEFIDISTGQDPIEALQQRFAKRKPAGVNRGRSNV